MTDKPPAGRDARARPNPDKILLPILIFAPMVTLLCWSAAWVFRDDYVFKATLIGLGCFTIVVGVVACLLVLVRRIERD